MNHTCPYCGAGWQDENENCESVFNAFLALEFNQPLFYGRVHMLTVACFMIQHNRYSDEALVWMERQLHDFLHEGKSVNQIRARTGREVQQNKRSWRMSRQEGDRCLAKVNWSMNILDVARAYADAESYCTLITRWAELTLHEMGPLLPG
ncbi:MAG: DUF5946 family protein [Anaerolineae bacterium]|nr:DUF5946 family protein [Anaerolineae bacterium]